MEKTDSLPAPSVLPFSSSLTKKDLPSGNKTAAMTVNTNKNVANPKKEAHQSLDGLHDAKNTKPDVWKAPDRDATRIKPAQLGKSPATGATGTQAQGKQRNPQGDGIAGIRKGHGQRSSSAHEKRSTRRQAATAKSLLCQARQTALPPRVLQNPAVTFAAA
jgi:hypothetical protein